MTAVLRRLGARRGDAPPDSPRDLVIVLRPDAAACADLIAAACEANCTVAVVLPLKVHGYSLGMPNPGLMPTARERAAAEEAITTTVNRLRKAGVDVDGQIVVTRHAHRAIPRIVRRRGATRVIVAGSSAGRLRRLIEGDLHSQLRRRLRPIATVDSMPKAG